MKTETFPNPAVRPEYVVKREPVATVPTAGPPSSAWTTYLRKNSSSDTPSIKGEPVTSMVQFRPFKKRSRSPEPARAPPGVPNFKGEGGYENKRVKTDNGGHRAPPPPPARKNRGQQNQKSRGKPKAQVKSKGTNKKFLPQHLTCRAFKPNKNNPLPNPQSQIGRGVGRELETTVRRFQAPGYTFVPSGNVYITQHCKRLTLESGRDLWKIDIPRMKGIQVPLDVYKTVRESERATREIRKLQVDKVDKKEKDEARECLLNLFPNLPPGEDDVILGRAWERSSGRVGRTSKLTLDQKVRKAVVAHVRHTHSTYDRRLRTEFIKNGRQRVKENILQKVRNETWKEVNDVVNSWKQPGAARITKPQNTNKAFKNPRKPNKKTEQQKQAKRERKALKRMNETEEERKTRLERAENKRIRKAERRLIRQQNQALAAEERNLQGENAKGKGRAEQIDVIIIDTDSEDDSINSSNSNIYEGAATEDRNSKKLRIIDLQESDGEEEDEADNAENWDIGEEDDDDDFFYAEDTNDEDYVDLENIITYPEGNRHTRSSARAAVVQSDKNKGEGREEGEYEGNVEDGDEDMKTGEDNEGAENAEDDKDLDDAEEQMHREEEEAARSQVWNEDEINLDFDYIESAYQDLLLFSSGLNAKTTNAETTTQQQAETESEKEEKPVTVPDVHITVADMVEIHEANQKTDDPAPLDQAKLVKNAETVEKAINQKREKRIKTEVEEAEEELYRDFGFSDENIPYFDESDNMEIEVEDKLVIEKEVEKVIVAELEQKAEVIQEEKPEAKPENVPEERLEDNQKLEPEEMIPQAKTEDESDEEFVKKEYQVGGYIVEEFVRVKRVKAKVGERSVKKTRSEQASGSGL